MGEQGEFMAPRPTGVEHYDESQLFELNTDARQIRVLLAWTSEREAWGARRRRAVVFHIADQVPAKQGLNYPWIEFVQTDDGRYAAPIPDPQRPKAQLADRAQLPGRFSKANVQRTDALFSSAKDAPSLRIVVSGDDRGAMVLHGFWVATLRGRAHL